MHLINALIAGMKGAESGTATLFARGTSTGVVWYSDFEAQDSNPAGTPVSLDPNGRAEVYVNTLVDVVVKNSAGATVAQFTAGASASGIEVMSQSFTGRDYTDAASAAGNPTTLQAVLDLWKTNAGAIDWKVLLGGTATTLESAMASAGGLVFNVKDPAYGALGDGATDDLGSIQAAINAANTAGGGIVFFPVGIYNISAELTWHAGVSLVGVGPEDSVIRTTSSSAHILNTSGTSAVVMHVSGLYLSSSVTNTTGAGIQADGNADVLATNCRIGPGATLTYRCVYVGSTARVRLVDCDLAIGSPGSHVEADGELNMVRCKLSSVSAAHTPTESYMVGFVAGSIRDCEFDFASLPTSGTFDAIEKITGTGVCRVQGCRFTANSGATAVAMAIGTIVSTTDWEDSGCSVDANTTLYSLTTDGTAVPTKAVLGSRLGRVLNMGTVNTTPVSVDILNYEDVIIQRTTITGQTLNLSTRLPAEGHAKIVIRNTSGSTLGNPIFTAGTGFGFIIGQMNATSQALAASTLGDPFSAVFLLWAVAEANGTIAMSGHFVSRT